MNFEEYLNELADAARKLKIADLQRLSDLSPEQAEQLAARWPDIDVRRRRRILRQLIELAEDNVELDFDGVFIHALGDEDAKARQAAILGLWEYEGPEIIGLMVDIITGDKNAAVRAEAALSLGRFVLLFKLGRLRERHFQRAAAGLRKAIEDVKEVADVRGRSLEAMGPHDETWVRQAITQAYESGNRRLKVSAVHAMGRSAEPRWLALLARELTSEDAELRYEAAVACGTLGDEGAVISLIPLVADSDEQARAAAIAALGEIGGTMARQALNELLESHSPLTRDAASAALSEMQAEENPLGFRLGG